MKYSPAVEQACCIMGLVATAAKEHSVVTNDKLSSQLKVSPSYLKKITRKLTVAELITSALGSRGGFTLARPMKKITLLDVVEAIEEKGSLFRPTGLIEQVFHKQERAANIGLTRIEQTFNESEEAAKAKLRRLTLETLLKEIREDYV